MQLQITINASGRSKHHYLEDVFCLSRFLPTGFRPSAVRLGALVSMLLRGPVSGSVGVGGSDGNDGSPPLGLDFRMEVGVFWVGLVAPGFDRSGGGGGAAGTTDLGGGMSLFTETVRDKDIIIIYLVMNALFKSSNKDLRAANISFQDNIFIKYFDEFLFYV